MSNLLLFELVCDLLQALAHKLVNRSVVPLVGGVLMVNAAAKVVSHGVHGVCAHLHLLQGVTICAARNAGAPSGLASGHLLDH